VNILLVYPEMPETFWSMAHFLKISGKKSCYPPLGLLTVAAMLPKEWNRRLLDLNTTKLSKSALQWADYVFISAMNVQEVSTRDILVQCAATGVKVVAGGPLFAHQYKSFENVDHFILNEAEITFPVFLDDLDKGSPKAIYKTNEFADIRQTPLPRWELVNLDDYQYGIIQSSRGCPFNCDFCDVTILYGSKPRIKTVQQIISELDILAQNTGLASVLFADDNLIGNKKHLKNELLPALRAWRKQRRPSFSFGTQVSVNLADDPVLMRMMIEAGFRHLFVGIETPEEESLLSSKKSQNTKRDLMASIRRLHKAGFVVVGGFIIGFDTDPPDIFQRQIDFIQDSGIVLSVVNLLKAPPGTRLYARMKEEGRLLNKFSFLETDTNIIPQMDTQKLFNGFKRVIETVYSPQYTYLRTIKFLQEYQKPARVGTPVPALNPIRYFGTFLRSLFFIGILGKERLYYWKLLFWTFKKRRRLMDWAFINTLMIFQLRKLYENYRKKLERK